MNIIVAPVSGGSFPKQVCIMWFLAKKIKYKPDIALGASGGAVSLYLLLAAEWNDYNIERVINCISSDTMVENVAPGIFRFLPGPFTEIMKGCRYRMSPSINTMFEQNFTYERICNIETWIAAVDNDTGYVDLFCNRSIDKCNIRESGRLPRYKANCNYINGDIDKIANAVKASSSIPGIFEPVKIDDKEYIDSGAKIGSPLSPMSVVLEETYDTIHIIYVNGYDLESDPPMTGGSNIFSVISNAGNKVVRSMVEQDRNRGISIICKGRSANYKEFTIDRLIDVFPRIQESESSFLEIYVDTESVINYTDFKSEDILEFISFCEDKIKCRLWWIGDDIFSGIGLEEEQEVNQRRWNYQDMTLYENPNYRL